MMANRIPRYDETVLWKDRRRRLGLPLSFTRYSLTATRLFFSTGLFNLHEDEILLYRVLDICMRITLLDRLFGVGTIELVTRDESLPKAVLKKIKRPKRVRTMLSNEIERARRENGVVGREMFGAEGGGSAHFDGFDSFEH